MSIDKQCCGYFESFEMLAEGWSGWSIKTSILLTLSLENAIVQKFYTHTTDYQQFNISVSIHSKCR